MVWLAETPVEIREAAERYGHERSVSSLWFGAIQTKWSPSYWAAEPSMQGMWSPMCPPGGPPGDWRRAAPPRGTLTPREDFSPWHLPGSRRQSPVAHGLSGHPLCGVACSSACAACSGSPRGDHGTSGGGSGRDVELRGEKGQQAMGVDRDGPADAAHHCLLRWGSPSRERETVVGQSSCGIPQAGDMLYGSICGLHWGYS